jgi:F420-dependent oxidoreductase-like protein
MSELIKLGLQIPSFTYPGVDNEHLFDAVIAQAVAAEQAGFDSVFVMDHFYQLPLIGQPQDNMLEAYTVLAALAASTSTVRLGAMVGGVTYRNPAFLAKVVTTLDIVSAGRAIWSIGAGWFEQEHDAYGYEFGTFADRFEKLEEALQIVKSMFVNDTTTFDGKWFQTAAAMNNPKPVQVGGPPVLIGGSGERKTLRMVAQYADACNVFGDAAQVRHLLGVLDEHCAALGRDPTSICRTRLGTLVIAETMEQAEAKLSIRLGGAKIDDLPEEIRGRIRNLTICGDPDTVGERVQELLDAGLDGIIFNMALPNDLEGIHLGAATVKPLLNP